MTQDSFARLDRRAVRGTAIARFARAQSRVVKIGMLNDMGFVYADDAGGGLVAAAFRAIEQSTCRMQF